MGKLKNTPETYIMDYKRRVGVRYERKPNFEKGDGVVKTDENILKINQSVSHLNKRFEAKDKNLKGKGNIKNKFIILDIEAKDKAGNKHNFMWNVGMAGVGIKRFSSQLTTQKIEDFLKMQQEVVEIEDVREYEDVKINRVINMDFSFGFKVKNVIHRSIVETTPENLKATTQTMGRRNLHVKRLG